MKRRRVVFLAHEDLIPPEEVLDLPREEYKRIKTEVDVFEALKNLGHDVVRIGLHDEMAPLAAAIKGHEPHVVFNLLEEFRDKAIFDAYVVAYIELTGTPYTGCNPRGLVISRDKAMSKKILAWHRIRVPRFFVARRGRKPRKPAGVEFPLFVKSLVHDGSEGIAQASVVTNEAAFEERVTFMHDQLKADCIVEEFVEGREIYVAVMGNQRLQVFPTWELFLDKLPDDSHRIATRKAKFDEDYQKRYGIEPGRARDLDPAIEKAMAATARRVCRRLGLDGYVRIDFRLRDDGRFYFLEANCNPDISYGAEFASAAEAAGLSYERLIDRILSLGIRRSKGG